MAKAAEALNASPIFIALNVENNGLSDRRVRYARDQILRLLSNRPNLRHRLCSRDGKLVSESTLKTGDQEDAHQGEFILFKAAVHELVLVARSKKGILHEEDEGKLHRGSIVHTRAPLNEENGDIYFGYVDSNANDERIKTDLLNMSVQELKKELKARKIEVHGVQDDKVLRDRLEKARFAEGELVIRLHCIVSTSSDQESTEDQTFEIEYSWNPGEEDLEESVMKARKALVDMEVEYYQFTESNAALREENQVLAENLHRKAEKHRTTDAKAGDDMARLSMEAEAIKADNQEKISRIDDEWKGHFSHISDQLDMRDKIAKHRKALHSIEAGTLCQKLSDAATAGPDRNFNELSRQVSALLVEEATTQDPDAHLEAVDREATEHLEVSKMDLRTLKKAAEEAGIVQLPTEAGIVELSTVPFSALEVDEIKALRRKIVQARLSKPKDSAHQVMIGLFRVVGSEKPYFSHLT